MSALPKQVFVKELKRDGAGCRNLGVGGSVSQPPRGVTLGGEFMIIRDQEYLYPRGAVRRWQSVSALRADFDGTR